MPFGSGHINDTYRVVTESQDYILQRVNGKVFRTQELVNNYEVLIDKVSNYQDASGQKITPDIFQNKSGNYHLIDPDGSAWRLVEFITNADSFDISPNPEISFKAAKAIGKYQLFLNTIESPLVQDTIVGFHNLPSRMKAFVEAVDSADKALIDTAAREVEQSWKLSYIVQGTEKSLAQLPPRITHNDTKLNNVLFVGNEVLMIDLDTVMKGNVMFDFGDMVRTFTTPAAEDEKDLTKVVFRIDHFEALTKGYLEPLKDDLSQPEKESLLPGALYIIYEQALRFLTDYLNSSIYYKTVYPEHNLVRTRTQLKLLESVIQKQPGLEKIISLYS